MHSPPPPAALLFITSGDDRTTHLVEIPREWIGARGFDLETGGSWQPHPIAGIKMRVLALDRERDYATLLLDVAPGTSFPPHHHDGPEECYIVSGSAYTYGHRMGPGDFLHADAGTDHSELYTEEGCRVLLVVRPEDYMV